MIMTEDEMDAIDAERTAQEHRTERALDDQRGWPTVFQVWYDAARQLAEEHDEDFQMLNNTMVITDVALSGDRIGIEYMVMNHDESEVLHDGVLSIRYPVWAQRIIDVQRATGIPVGS